MDRIGWPAAMAEHDLVWGSLPERWTSAPFLGNGEQGTMIYRADKQALRWDIGCSAAHDHRPVEADKLDERVVEALNRGRHAIGHLRLELPVEPTGFQARLNLWDAEAVGTIRSAAGELHWTTLVHANGPVMRIETEATGDLAGARFVYVPEQARGPRELINKQLREPANPSPVSATLPDGVRTVVHHLHAGGQTAVAWFEQEVAGTRRVWLSVQHSFPGKEAEAVAVTAVRAAAAADPEAWLKAHRDWWHDYYPASFVSTGDPYWDSFYWIQQYKRACATRDKGWILDNQGPWLQPTAWNCTWWNLNVQLSHSGTNEANRREMASALSYRLDLNRDNLARNVAEPYRADSYAIARATSGWDLLGHAGQPGGREPMDDKIGRECGNLLWALHNVDLEYRHSMDVRLRDKVLYPLLLRAVNYYRHFLVEEDDGLLHLPSTFSPELANVEDCSYDISLLRWGVGRLLELAAEQGITGDQEPLIASWTDIRKRLVPEHVDETGIMVGRKARLNTRHRHWSHLLSIYPLRTLTPDTPEHRDLIQRSLDRWHSFGAASGAYSFTGGSCISSILGDGERALDFLNRLKPHVKPNTFYTEAASYPVIETPLHGATAIQEMLLQSWGGRLRVFPAVSKAWPDVQFHQLRGEGAYLVSARREAGKTQWVVVKAEARGTVELDPGIADAQWSHSEGVEVKGLTKGVYQIQVRAGDWVKFFPQGQAEPEVTVKPVARRGELHRFGMPEGWKD